MSGNNFRAALRRLGRRRPFHGPFLCAACEADSHEWQVVERRLPDEPLVPIVCRCSHCDCGAGRILRLHTHTDTDTPAPKDTTPPEFGRLLALDALLSPAAHRALERDLRRTNAVYRRVRRETREAVFLLIGAVVLMLTYVGLTSSDGCTSTAVQVVGACGVLAALFTVALLAGSRAPLLSAAVAAHAERQGPLTCRRDAEATDDE